MALTIATAGLAFVAWKGLKSLTLTKADMLTRAHRDARSCAVARCQELAEQIIPKNGDLVTRFAALNLPMFVQSADMVRFNPDAGDHLAQAHLWLAKVPSNEQSDSIGLLNRLEAWAMHFTSGVADHDFAFGPCAPVFCSLVVRYYPVLLVGRASNASGKYPNMVKMFEDWRTKLEAEQNGIKLQALVRKQGDLQKRHASLPPPLGTLN